MATNKRDYYEVLGVARDGSDADIKRAFRKLARELHPDVNPDPAAEARFKELAEAYEVLSSPESRASYDRYGHEGVRGQAGATAGFGSFQDLFNAFFGGDAFGFGGAGGPAPGDDLLAVTQITFVESALGVEGEVAVTVEATCEPCEGRGYPEGASVDDCRACEGRGEIRETVRSPFGQFLRTQPCRVCQGRGAIVRERCPECRGAGRVRERRTVSVAIPGGIANGQRIRLVGRGSAGDPGGEPGDLYVEVRVADDARFARDQLDILSRATVSVAEAMVGTTMAVPTVEGDVEIEVPAGSQSGDEVRLRGKGFPSLQGRGRGDGVVILVVEVPKVVDEEGRRLVAALDEHLAASAGRDGLFGRLRGVFK